MSDTVGLVSLCHWAVSISEQRWLGGEHTWTLSGPPVIRSSLRPYIVCRMEFFTPKMSDLQLWLDITITGGAWNEWWWQSQPLRFRGKWSTSSQGLKNCRGLSWCWRVREPWCRLQLSCRILFSKCEPSVFLLCQVSLVLLKFFFFKVTWSFCVYITKKCVDHKCR